jgi:uncharacterized protein (TIGR03437 family)
VEGAVIPSDSPAVTSRGILHLFSPQQGAAVAPGTIIQIYGQTFSESTGQAAAIPLPTTVGDTSISIGGIPAPLFYVSSSQINAQVPFDLKPGRQVEVVVNRKGVLSAAETLQVSNAVPGLITVDGGYLLAQHSDGSAVSVSAPAQSGESLVTYAAGLGATDQPVSSGAAGPSNPLARPLVQPELTINGLPAPIQFAGLTPGLVGLYQINFVVPFSPDGDLSVQLTQAEATSNAALLRVKNRLP